MYSYVIIGVIVACLSCIIVLQQNAVKRSFIEKPEKIYDFIIVGGGTAGCVLAARLSEDPETTVLLIEAGSTMSYFSKIPLTPTAAQLGPNDWSVRTAPQKYSSFGLWDQTQILPRGKGLGGSGQINFLLHGFGLPGDFNNWSRHGFHGWTLDNLKSYFIKAFGSTESDFDSESCSFDGYCQNWTTGSKAPMKLKRIDEQNELMQVFRQAAPMKLKRIDEQNELMQVFRKASDLLRNKQTLFRKPTATIKDGRRHVALDAYLQPVLHRKNLHVLLNTQAISIRFENKTASSVYILRNHQHLDNIFVNKEIILAAGAIKTPQLLIVSGIGPREQVKKLKLPLIAENEQVSQNLHDHMNMPIYVSIKKPISLTLSKVFSFGAIWDFLWNNKGLIAFPPVAGVEYQNTSALMLFSLGMTSEKLLRDLSNYQPKVFRDTFPFYKMTNKEGFMFLATCLHPRSRGTVTVTRTSISIPPVVNPNYLHKAWDVKCMIRAIRRAESLVSTKPFKDIGARIHWPRPERCLTFWNYTKEEQTGIVRRRRKKSNPQDILESLPREIKPKQPVPKLKSPPDVFLECILREVAVTGHHAAGTCAGGTVVDDQLRVKSVSGLRIMDASVLPSPLSLYPNSVLIGMAERAADLIQSANRPKALIQ